VKISNNKSYINHGPEGVPERNVRSKWTQWLYFLFLLAIIGYIIYSVVRPYYVVEITGSIHVEQLTLSSPINATLTTVEFNSGDSIKSDDVLMTLTPTAVCNSEFERTKQEQDKLEKQRKLKYEQQINRAKRGRLQARLAALKDSQGSPIARALEVNAALFNEDDQKKIERERAELEIEIDYLARLIGLGQQQINAIANEPIVIEETNDCDIQQVTSAKPGQISYIFKDRGEYISRGDDLLNITPSDAMVAIVLDLDSELINSFFKSATTREYTVLLPDGSESLAKVANSRSGRFTDLSMAVQSQRSSQNSRVLLEPVNPNDSNRWIQYAGTAVTIIGDK